MRLLFIVLIFAFPYVQAGDVLRFKVGIVRNLAKDHEENFWTRLKHLMTGEQALPQRYFIVQYKNSLTPNDLNFLTAQQISVVNYVPDDALLIRVMNRDQLQRLEEQPQVRGVVPYLQEWKLSPELSLVSGKNQNVGLFVRLLTDEDFLRYKNFLLEKQISFRALSKNSFYLQVPVGQVIEVSGRDEVEWSEPWVHFQPWVFNVGSPEIFSSPVVSAATYEDLSGFESGTRLIGFEKVWERNLKGQGQVIGVGDTGVDVGDVSNIHPDLRQIFKGFGLSRNDHSWADYIGHGTHVAGSIIGSGALSKEKILGGAFKAKLFVQAIADENGIVRVPGPEALTQALQEGVTIYSNSWGSRKTSYDNNAAYFDEFIWKHPHLLVLFAAGNMGGDFDHDGVVDEASVGTPATAKNVLTVGASENRVPEFGFQLTMGEYSKTRWSVPPLSMDRFSDNPNGIAGFSSRGPTEDGRRKPDIVAPGTNILSTRSQVPESDVLWGAFNDKYVFSGGTSMATPIAASAAAVIRQNLVDVYKLTNPSAALLKAIIMHTADDLFPGQYGVGQFQEIPTQRPNNIEGFGRINVEHGTNLSGMKIIDEDIGVGNGDRKTYSLKAMEGEKIRITLNYTDAPGLVSTGRALVNNLDLEVKMPNGHVVSGTDSINNNEYLEFSASTTGSILVTVIGTTIVKAPGDKQSFALVMSKSESNEVKKSK